MHSDFRYICRVCGLRQSELPWGEDGKIPSFNICPCCGVEFGYEDVTKQALLCYRQEWLKNGGNWFNSKEKPDNFNLEVQLKNIPKEYL